MDHRGDRLHKGEKEMKTRIGIVLFLFAVAPMVVQASAPELTWMQAYTLAAKMNQNGDWPEALRTAKQSLDRASYVFGRNSLNASKSHILLGDLYAERGKYASAEMHYLTGISIWNKLFGSGHVGAIRPLTSLADLYASQEKLQPALEYYTKAIDSGRNGQDPGCARALLGVAELKAKAGLHEESVALLKQVFEISRHSGKYATALCPVAIRSLSDMGEIYMTQGKYLQAASSFKRAMELVESKGQPDGLLLYSLLTRTGDAYRNAGSKTLASNYYRRAIAVHDQQRGPRIVTERIR
jgi:tetratricopeptide (TPR) repeat protein